MLSPSLRSVLKSLLQREDAEERDGWLLLSMEEEEELLGPPIATTHRERGKWKGREPPPWAI